MNFDEYQEFTVTTANYPTLGHPVVYPALGLSGEVGEIAEKIKKLMRDKNGVVDPEFRADLKKELGDVLWYVSRIASELGLSMLDVAQTNVAKLEDRKKRGVIKGSGDDR